MISNADLLQKVHNPILFNPLALNPSVVEEKYQKHLKESEPILAGTLTPYEAFKEGFERAIGSYIKLGNEGTVKKINSEAPIKNVETELMEELIKYLLLDFKSVRFIEKNGQYYAIAKGKIYNFSLILERANFNLIKLTNKNLVAYQQLLNKGKLFQQPYLNGTKPTAKDFEDADPEKICRTISYAEKEAINIYTGSFYQVMNSLLRGNIGEAIQNNYLPLTEKERVNHTIKEALLHIVVAVHGLNRLPDFEPPVGPDGNPQKYLFRSEGSLPESVLAKRKWAIANGGGTLVEAGFISTAYLKPVSGFFGEHTASAVMIKNLKGKKITPLSQYGTSEREVLLPPTQMQWKYEKEIITDVFKNTMHLFIAKPVTVNEPSITTKGMYVKTISKKDHLFLGFDTSFA